MADRSEKERTSRMLRKGGGNERGPGERHTAREVDDLVDGGGDRDRGGGSADRDNNPSA